MRWTLAVSVTLAACSGSSSSPSFGSVRWAVSLGDNGNDTAFSTAIDSHGDVLAAGERFITKRDGVNGAELWTARLPSSASSGAYLTGLALSNDDSVIVTGDYVGTVDFGGQTLITSGPLVTDAFAARYSPAGTLAWARGLGATHDALGLALAIDQDDVIVAGEFENGPLDLAGQTFTPLDRAIDCFVAGFDPSGSLQWGRAIQGTTTGKVVEPNSVTTTANGDVLVGGTFTGPISFNGSAISPAGEERAFIARFGIDGTARALVTTGPDAPGESEAMQAAVAGTLTIVQTQEWDQPGPDEQGALHAFDANGVEIWSAQLPADGGRNPQLRALAVATGERVVSSGWVDGPYDSDHPDRMTGDMEVASFDMSGVESTSTFGRRLFGSAYPTTVRSSAAGPSGETAFFGEFSGALELGTTLLSTQSGATTNAYLTLVDPQ